MASLEPKSKVLVIGALEHFGMYIAAKSVQLGHFTLVMVPSTTDYVQDQIIQKFVNIGVALFRGDIYNHSRLVRTIRGVDVVISVDCGESNQSMLLDLSLILTAINEAGNITRFIASGSAIDVDHTHVLPAAETLLEMYRQKRRLIEQSGVPYTHIVRGFFPGHFLGRFNSQQSPFSLPIKIPLYGDGNTKVVFLLEKDAAHYTILAADDPRTLNKTLYIMPPENVLSVNDIVSLWEGKINRSCDRVYIPSEAFLKLYNEARPEIKKIELAFLYSAFIRGDQTNFEINPAFGVEASQLFSDVNYTTIDEYLNRFLPHQQKS